VRRKQRQYQDMKRSAAAAVGKLNLRKLAKKGRKKIARQSIEKRWREARAQEKKARRHYD
jgi:hypothetical protein